MRRAPFLRLSQSMAKPIGRSSFLRSYSSNVNKETDTYVQRKEIVTRNPTGYYPPIESLRYSKNSYRIPTFRRHFEGYDFLVHENKRYPEEVLLEGRIASIRKSGKGMYFIDIVQDNSKVQVMASNKAMNLTKDEFSVYHEFLRSGDSVVMVGYPSITDVGELTLKASEPIKCASICLNSTSIPAKITKRSLINKNRVLNYLVNSDSRQILMIKSNIIQSIRQYFLERDFIEVNTPILAGHGTGANAEPFTTEASALSDDKQLQLRVAPELWLKRLIVGGFDKIFEIGQSFRNEGIDSTHNPEFTTCEFYQTFTSLHQLMSTSESLLKKIFSDLEKNSNAIPLLSRRLPLLETLKQDSFPRYEFIPTLEKVTGLRLPSELTSENLLKYHMALGIPAPKTQSPQNLLDNLSSLYLESLSKGSNLPIFLFNQPAIMSPLSKSLTTEYDSRPFEISLRFELFINGKEYINAYEEENSPFEQHRKFELQQLSKSEYMDNEAVVPDWEYVKSMEYGLPPTGGWGCGIDRLAMLFSGSVRIEDVLSFGSLRDVVRQ